MPKLNDYLCLDCEFTFEKMRWGTEEIRCPTCESANVEVLPGGSPTRLHSPTAIRNSIWKGKPDRGNYRREVPPSRHS